jgi:magnesium chelatase family protein
LLDRIDLHVDVPRVETEKLLEEPEAESSASVRERVERARRTALARGVTCNAEIPLRRLREVCALDGDANGVLAKSSRRRQLSARAVHRLLRMARTIADLEGSDDVSNTHVQEALNFAVDASGAS